jgi:hypothetical protein
LNSYRVRELLICWLIFIGIFAVLALTASGGALAWYAGKRAFYWAQPLLQIPSPVLPVPVEIHLKRIPASRSWKY